MRRLDPAFAKPQARLLRRLRIANALFLLVWGGFGALILALGGRAFGLNMAPWIGGGALLLLLWGLWCDFRFEHRLSYRLDRLAGLSQGFATASSLSESGAEPGPVGRQLLAEQKAASETLAFGRLAPLLPAKTWIGAALCLGAGAVFLNTTLASLPQSTRPEAPLEESAAAEAPLAETLEKIAERMAEDALKEDNTYLSAVAKSLQEKAEALAAAPQDEALRAQIDTLLEHARRAYGEKPPSWLGDGSTAQPLEAITQAFADALARQAEALKKQAEREAEYGDRIVDMYKRDPSLEERYQGRDTTETISAQDADPLSGMSDGKKDDMGAGSAGGAPRRLDDEELQSLGGAPVGAALESGKGESDMAGLGSQDFAEDATYRDVAAAAGEAMSLTAENASGGNRIRIEIAPEANEESQTSGTAQNRFSPAELDRAAMGANRSDIPVSARGIVAKYLDRRTASGGSEEEQ